MLLWIVFAVLAFILDGIGWLSTKENQILFVIFVGVIYGAFMIWNALTFRVSCPRCGWNIYFIKGTRIFPRLALFTPSNCPKCGLDFEHTPLSKT